MMDRPRVGIPTWTEADDQRLRLLAVSERLLAKLRRLEPAYFDWRWRERPVLALLAWETLARDPLARWLGLHRGQGIPAPPQA
jgi:hypothetical protein